MGTQSLSHTRAARTGRSGKIGRMSAPARRPSPLSFIATGFAAIVIAALLTATGYMLWQHRTVAEQRRQIAEYTATARQDVVNLMSMDHTKAKESVQRVIDSSTGKFRANFADTAEEFAKALTEEKITTTASVNDAALESMTRDSAVVLVSATSRREGPGAPKDQQAPRVWRVVVTLERDGDQMKMSGVEFA